MIEVAVIVFGAAVAFGLGALGAQELRLADLDTARAEALAADLGEALPGMRVSVWADPGAGAAAADGVINCTPLGMEGKPGTPLPGARMVGPGWAFDAVYTPPDTEFLRAADAAGRAVISGWELFFYQGVHAWDLFSGGLPLDQDALRRDLKAAP